MLIPLIIVGVITLLAIMATSFNMARMGKNIFDFDDDAFENFGKGFYWHCILGGIAGVGSMAFVFMLVAHLVMVYA